MKLNLQQIKSIALGAEEVLKDDLGFHFLRFCEAETNYYRNTEFMQKTLSTSGIKLSFKTNSSFLKLNFKILPGATRTYFAVCIFVNGKIAGVIKNFEDKCVLGKHYPSMQFELGDFEGSFDLGDGEKEIKIAFPWSVQAVLKEIELSDNATLTPVKKDKIMLCYGDSITHGYDALYPHKSYAELLAGFFDAEIHNKAIGAEIFCPSLSKIKMPYTPDIITVAYGTNDWNKCDRETFENNCTLFFKNLATNYPDTPIFAITPLWRKEYTETRPLGKFSYVADFIKNVCSKYKNITVIEGFDIIGHDEVYFADFRLHPNDNGYKIYADYLYEKISKAL